MRRTLVFSWWDFSVHRRLWFSVLFVQLITYFCVDYQKRLSFLLQSFCGFVFSFFSVHSVWDDWAVLWNHYLKRQWLIACWLTGRQYGYSFLCEQKYISGYFLIYLNQRQKYKIQSIKYFNKPSNPQAFIWLLLFSV